MRRRWIQPSTASLRRATGGSSHLRPPLMRPRRIRPSRAPLDLLVQDQATDLAHPSPRLTSFPPCRTSPATNRRPRASTSPPGYSACECCPSRSRQLGGVGVSAHPDDEFPPVSWTTWEQCGVCLCSAVPPDGKCSMLVGEAHFIAFCSLAETREKQISELGAVLFRSFR